MKRNQRLDGLQQTLLMTGMLLCAGTGTISSWSGTMDRTLPWATAAVIVLMAGALVAGLGAEVRTRWSASLTGMGTISAAVASWTAVGAVGTVLAATIALGIAGVTWHAIRRLYPVAGDAADRY